jgi:anti-anti-sigma factor
LLERILGIPRPGAKQVSGWARLARSRTRMAIEVRESRGVYLISGELDLVSAEQFRHMMEPALDATGEIVLDLADVTFIDSIGLRSITLLAKMIGERGIVLRYPRDPVLRVLELIDIEEIPGIRIERW